MKLSRQIQITQIIYFRIAFGSLMVWEVIRFWVSDKVSRYYIKPEFMFKYFGFEWVKPLPETLIYVLFFLMGIAALGIAVGYLYRISSATFFILYSYFFLLDESRYLNHYYLISMIALILTVIPANLQFSIDVARQRVNPVGKIPYFYLLILQFTIALPYFFGAIAKMNSDWIKGEPLRMWLHNSAGDDGIAQYFQGEFAPYLLAWSGLLLDLLVIPLVLWKKSRWYAISAVLLFHLINSQLFTIGVFPWLMIAATLILFLPNWKPIWKVDQSKKSKEQTVSIPKWLFYGVSAFLLYNSFMPLRHWLYPGNVSWTEEGHKFAWHMKLRSKESFATFYAVDPATRIKTAINDSGILLKHQLKSYSDHPDKNIQYSKYLKQKLYPNNDVEIRATVWASLNGRPFALLLDSNVNLLTTSITLKHNPIIQLSYPPLPPKGGRFYEGAD